MAEYKIVKGQAWINNDSLVQEQIMIIPGKSAITNVVAIVENIWDDLTSASGLYKCGSKPGYFYWEYEMTDTEDDDVTRTINYECPRPKPGLFSEPYDPESVEGDYAKYWVERLKTAKENYEKEYAIQRKEILLKGTTYLGYMGDDIVPTTIDDMVVVNSEFGDITNLLNLF